MSEFGHRPNRTSRHRDRRGTDPYAGRSAIGPRGTCPTCGRGLMPGLEQDEPYCLECADIVGGSSIAPQRPIPRSRLGSDGVGFDPTRAFRWCVESAPTPSGAAEEDGD